MSKKTKDLVSRIGAALAAGDPDLMEGLYAPDVIDHNPLPAQSEGIAGIKEKAAALVWAFADLKREVSLVVAEGDHVVERWTLTGTHQDAFLGMPGSGREILFGGISIYRIEEGLVVEEWTEFDGLELLEQLAPAPAAAP